jgi:hypothetical protein
MAGQQSKPARTAFPLFLGGVNLVRRLTPGKLSATRVVHVFFANNNDHVLTLHFAPNKFVGTEIDGLLPYFLEGDFWLI